VGGARAALHVRILHLPAKCPIWQRCWEVGHILFALRSAGGMMPPAPRVFTVARQPTAEGRNKKNPSGVTHTTWLSRE
jgi:hypothetical protein